MRDRIHGSLQPVRRRRLGLFLLQAVLRGLIVAASVVILVKLAMWLGFEPSSAISNGWASVTVMPAVGLILLLAAPVAAMIAAAIRAHSYENAASAVDAHYKLKDRARTALSFLTKREPSDLHKLQIEDAEKHLSRVKAGDVAPFRLRRSLIEAAVLVVLAIVAFLQLPSSHGKKLNAAALPPIPSIVAEAEKTVERLKELEELAKSERDPELEKLVKELMEKAEEMKQPGVDLKEALAKLSEMQAKIAAQQAQYNVGMVDAQLQSLGAAMQAATATDAAGSALQDGKFEQAVKELEKLEEPPTEKKEAKTLEEKLKQVAQQMGEVGLGQMSGAATEMAEGVKGGNNAKFKKATKTLASLTKGHAGRRRIKQILDGELEALDESKAGECKSEFTMRGKRPEKSTSPSNNWGAATSGNVLGDKTKLQSTRKVEEITGNPGEGPSEMETTHSPEGKQKAARAYKESYDKYKKMSEDVLDSEPIPLGHRQTIRKYFELIRPSGADSGSTSKDAPAPTQGK